MKNHVNKQDWLIEKVLEILESMDDVTTKTVKERIYLYKDRLKFGYIENQEVYLVDRYKHYNKFPKSLQTESGLVKDEFLLDAIQAYFDCTSEGS